MNKISLHVKCLNACMHGRNDLHVRIQMTIHIAFTKKIKMLKTLGICGCGCRIAFLLADCIAESPNCACYNNIHSSGNSIHKRNDPLHDDFIIHLQYISSNIFHLWN